MNRLQVLQNSAARVIFGKRKRGHVTELLEDQHWLKVEPHIHFKVLCLVFKCIISLALAYLCNLIIIKDPLKMVFNIPRTNTAYGDRAYQTYGPRFWTALPHSLRIIPNLDRFNAQLKHYLFSSFDLHLTFASRLRQ